MKELISNLIFGLKVCFKASGIFFIIKIVLMIIISAVSLAILWLWRDVLNSITKFQDAGISIISSLIIYLVVKLLLQVIERLDSYINERYSDEMTFYIENTMMDLTSRMDLAFFDSASINDKIQHTRSNFFIIQELTGLVFNIITHILNLIIAFMIIATFNIWIGLITLILTMPSMIYNKKYTKYLLQVEKDQIRDNRMKDYYINTFYDNNIQFEIKLNDIGSYFIAKYKVIWNKLFKINNKISVKHNIVNGCMELFNIASDVLVIIVSINSIITGRIGIGDLQYNLNIIGNLKNRVSRLIYDINRFLINNVRLNELREFIKIKPINEKSGTLTPSANPKIEFDNISFRYPNSEEYVLKGCSFVIQPNEKVGLIGLNGAGKSTLIKLMFRFYDPENGYIKLDDIDIKEYDVYKVRKTFGVLFQDYVTYCLPMREIIALSEFESVSDDNKLDKACKISGADEIIEKWEERYDTVLGRYYADDGRDLSGGQWQLVGLARSYFKESNYMILDEPSAALDPIAEDRIFNQLYELSKGKSSVTISHRLSNTTLADKILVLDDGHVIEEGSHFELLRQGGKYAHLFNLQAEKYV